MKKTIINGLIFPTLDTSQLKNDDCESIYSVNPLYLPVTLGSRYTEQQNGNKYLIFEINTCLGWN